VELSGAVLLLAGVVAGVLAGIAIGRSQLAGRLRDTGERLATRDHEVADLVKTTKALEAERSGLKEMLVAERRLQAERLSLLDEAKEKFAHTFEALAADALRSNNQSFLELATPRLDALHTEAQGDLGRRQQAIDEMVKPLRESLERYERQAQQLEASRADAYGGLRAQLAAVASTQERLQAETGNLVRALRAPQVRGRWGEITLRRVVELAGMTEHCDFVEQPTVSTGERQLRPDLIVRLPGNRSVAVDAKAPLQAYLDALEATDDETRKARLIDHARQTRQHVQALASRAYWEALQPAPEIVILFLPAEAFFTAALEQAPDLIEAGVSQAVFIATPMTLVALLRAVAFGWSQEQVTRNAQAISELGRSLHERLVTLADHVQELRRALLRSVEAYNKMVGSLEGRVLVTGRRFKELGAASQGDIDELPLIDEVPRSLQAPDWSGPAAGTGSDTADPVQGASDVGRGATGRP
jgi:DNA recombination protein RmuC